MKDHLCGRYGVDPGRVAIIPNTFSLAKPGGNGDRAPSDGSEGARPFTFLYLTYYYAHKNIDILVDAARKLPKYTDKSAKCVITIVPEQHPGARRLLEQLDRGEAAGRIENIGPVPSEMLPGVYRRADALIFPTLLESFSRTYLEAMYFGLPILTSDRDFAHHLCGDAATYFDPLDADSVARAMTRVMKDADLRQGLVENGRRILAQAPTWDGIAARFVDALERTARGDTQRGGPSRQGLHALRGRGLVGSRGKGYTETPASNDVRTLFNHKARSWRSKYGARGKLDSRVGQFTVRLSELCPPPGNILDLGCGTGEIAAAVGQMGYQVTACDFAEEMIEVARSSHQGTAVQWVRLDPDWEVLHFADSSFDGIVASSVFEYLVDVPRVAAELARVLRPGGSLLLTVPNPGNGVRKVEAWLQSMLLHHRLPPLLRRVQRIDSYTTYLRLSRNRFAGDQWESLLTAAGFVALDKRDFSKDAWVNHAKAPLILLVLKRGARGPSQPI
jgi:ubiquinone/menaquinone biosynthesis C-methylase UbiE